jgi:hypothetical protein
MATTRVSPDRTQRTQMSAGTDANRAAGRTEAPDSDSSGASEITMPELTHDDIAARAYHRWQQRAGGPGSPEDDWYQASDELRAERATSHDRPRSNSASAS